MHGVNAWPDCIGVKAWRMGLCAPRFESLSVTAYARFVEGIYLPNIHGDKHQHMRGIKVACLVRL